MKAIIKAIIAGSVIIGIGLIVLMIALALNGWKFVPEFDMAQYSAEGEIGELKIENSVGNIRTEFYDGEKVTVDYPVSDRYSIEIGERDGNLTVNGLNKKHWYNFSFLPSTLPVTVVKIPRGSALKLSITANAGTVELAAGEYRETSVKVNAGSIRVLGMTCPEFRCVVNAGSFHADKIECPLVKVDVAAGSASLNVTGAKEEYTIRASRSAGSCNVSDQTGTTDKKIEINVSAGSVSVSFEA